jgi:hypothetical protein
MRKAKRAQGHLNTELAFMAFRDPSLEDPELDEYQIRIASKDEAGRGVIADVTPDGCGGWTLKINAASLHGGQRSAELAVRKIEAALHEGRAIMAALEGKRDPWGRYGA